MEGAGVLDSIGRGGCELRGNGQTLSVPFFCCKLAFRSPEGALHQVGWPERER